MRLPSWGVGPWPLWGFEQLAEVAEVNEEGRKVVVVDGGRQTVLWLIVVLLTVVATVQILRWDESGAAYAQNLGSQRLGARGIFAFAGQMSKGTYGVYMVDVDQMTIWAYEIKAGEPKKLSLIGARSWAYDRFLEEFNIEKPTPVEVNQLVEGQRARRAQSDGTAVPTAGSPEE